jgi:hypothetical protein
MYTKQFKHFKRIVALFMVVSFIFTTSFSNSTLADTSYNSELMGQELLEELRSMGLGQLDFEQIDPPAQTTPPALDITPGGDADIPTQPGHDNAEQDEQPSDQIQGDQTPGDEEGEQPEGEAPGTEQLGEEVIQTDESTIEEEISPVMINHVRTMLYAQPVPPVEEGILESSDIEESQLEQGDSQIPSSNSTMEDDGKDTQPNLPSNSKSDDEVDVELNDIQVTTPQVLDISPEENVEYRMVKLINFIHTLTVEQIVSLDETNIEEIERNQLYGILTMEQLEEVQYFRNPKYNVLDAGPLVTYNNVPVWEEDYSGNGRVEISDDSALKLSKTAKWDDQSNTAKITLEAYTTGVIESTETNVPADIVLVLDQSGSMEESYGTIQQQIDQAELNKMKRYKWDGHIIRYSWIRGGWGYDKGLEWISLPVDAVVYENVTITKMDALKMSIETFINKAVESGVDHRMAIVGFASGSDYEYENTELFTPEGTKVYGGIQANDYKVAFQDVSTLEGRNHLDSFISQLDTKGATQSDLGLEMATQIFENNPNNQNDITRNRAVIMFTDGEPTTHNEFSWEVAGNAVEHANNLKNTYQSTVYTIGVMKDANPSDVTSKVNKYMNGVSSNYPDATKITNGIDLGERVNLDKNYYLTASNPDGLNQIFESIFSQIEKPNINLSEHTVIKDVVSEYFQLVGGTDREQIKSFTSEFKGGTLESPEWSDRTPFTPTSVEIKEDVVEVKGFNFNENCLIVDSNGLPTYKGKKLIIEFDVKPIEGFIGGNNIPTNKEDSGIYDQGKLIKTFELPNVNIPINYDFLTSNQSIYITNTVESPESFLVNENGIISYKINNQFYTLDGMLNAFVDIVYTVKDAVGAKVGSYTIPTGNLNGTWQWAEGYIKSPLMKDETYKIEYSVTPITNNNSTEGKPPVPEIKKVGQEAKDAKVYIYTPIIACKDTEMYLGEKADEVIQIPLITEIDEKGQEKVKVNWVYRGNESKPIPPVTGIEPALTYAYEAVQYTDTTMKPDDFWFEQDTDCKIYVTANSEDITNETNITNKQPSKDAKHDFTICIKTCELTINKKVTTGIRPEDNFIFRVERGSKREDEPTGANRFPTRYKTTQVVITGEQLKQGNGSVKLTGLPIGEYTVSENIDWSWRYDVATDSANPVELSRINSIGSITLSNTCKKEKWLTDEVIKSNIFEVSSSATKLPLLPEF